MPAPSEDPLSPCLLRASAHAVQRAAGDVQAHAGAFSPTSGAPGPIVHIEEALDRLETAFHKMSGVVSEWADGGAAAEEAEALRRHLYATARCLSEARDGCAASRHWSRRLAEALAGELPPATDCVERPAPDAITLCEYGDGDDRRTLAAVVDDVTLTYDVVVVGPSGPARRLREHLPTLREARGWARDYVERAAGA